MSCGLLGGFPARKITSSVVAVFGILAPIPRTLGEKFVKLDSEFIAKQWTRMAVSCGV